MKGEEEEGTVQIHKGFLSQVHSTTIKTKPLKGEKTRFCAKQLVQQQGFTSMQSSSLEVNPAESLLVAAFHVLCFCSSSYLPTAQLSVSWIVSSWTHQINSPLITPHWCELPPPPTPPSLVLTWCHFDIQGMTSGLQGHCVYRERSEAVEWRGSSLGFNRTVLESLEFKKK